MQSTPLPLTPEHLADRACRRIALIPQKQRVTITELQQYFTDRRIVACDFLVEGMVDGKEVPGGYELEGVLNVDHHAPTPRMERPISSTHLALAHVQTYGPADEMDAVVINHVDADSVLSALIMAGLLAPDADWGQAALAADHMGTEHPVADLLQALQSARDLDLSCRNLGYLVQGRTLEMKALQALEQRHQDRQRAAELVRLGQAQWIGRVVFACLQTKLDAGLLPPLLPDAWVILTFSPLKDREGRWEVKVRKGLAAPDGFSLQRLNFHAFDPAYGGRWNAGSNNRGDGTPLNPKAYARHVAEMVDSVAPLHERLRSQVP